MWPDKRKFGSAAGILITVVFLYLSFRGVDAEAVLRGFAKLKPQFLLFAFAAAIFHQFVFAFKWKRILDPIKRISLRHAFWSLRIGYFFNAIFPAKIGEAVRVWFIHRLESILMPTVVGATVADRFMDFLGLVILAYAALWAVGLKSDLLPTEYLLILLVLAILALFLLRFVPSSSNKKYLSLVISFLHEAKRGLRVISQPRHFLSVSFWVLVGWGLHACMVLFLVQGLDRALSPAECFLVVTAVAVAAAIPSGPSNLGPFEYAAVFVLTKVFGWSPEEALVLALLYHFIQLIPTWTIGLVGYVIYQKDLVPELRRLKRAS